MKNRLALLWLIPLSGLAACQDCRPPKPGLLPPPLTKAEQLSRLNARAAIVQTLKARGSISVTNTDDKGTHSYSADAVILLRQRAPDHPYDPGADVLLIGKIAGSQVFEMGVNVRDHWIAFRVEPNTAYIGAMNLPPNPNSRAPIRADRVLTVLALSQLSDRADTRIAMTVNGEAGGPHANEVHVIRSTEANGAYIDRTYVIERDSGDIVEIRSYFPDGRPESIAKLSRYMTGTNKDGGTAAARFPLKLVIDAPADRTHIELTMDTYDVNPTIPAAAFETPDFAKLGQTVIRVD